MTPMTPPLRLAWALAAVIVAAPMSSPRAQRQAPLSPLAPEVDGAVAERAPGNLDLLDVDDILAPDDIGFRVIPPPRADPPAPWAEGVSEAQQARAMWHFARGIELHKQLLFAEAQAAYQRALQSWEHPKIYLYRGLAMSKLGDFLAAYESIERALRSDPRALRAHERALAERTASELLRGELAAITVRCEVAGARVRIGDESWFSGPGVQRKSVSPGSHSVTVDKPGYVSVTRVVLLRRGESAVIDPDLVPSGAEFLVEWRWSPALPWWLTGAALATTATGAGLMVLASKHRGEAEALLSENCPLPGADDCYSSPGVKTLRARADIERNVGVGLLLAGGGALVGALAMHYLNQPHRTRNEAAGGLASRCAQSSVRACRARRCISIFELTTSNWGGMVCGSSEHGTHFLRHGSMKSLCPAKRSRSLLRVNSFIESTVWSTGSCEGGLVLGSLVIRHVATPQTGR
ncbi:MAG: hypothetical protein Tsb0020_00980 [Haliangiales bacterium]